MIQTIIVKNPYKHNLLALFNECIPASFPENSVITARRNTETAEYHLDIFNPLDGQTCPLDLTEASV